MPIELLGEEGRVNPDSPKPYVALEFEEDEPTNVSWVANVNKRQKMIQIPNKVK